MVLRILRSITRGRPLSIFPSFFFFNDTATTEIYTLSLHDALPICRLGSGRLREAGAPHLSPRARGARSEEHTSELQSLAYLVCRLLLEKKNRSSFGVRTWSLGTGLDVPALTPPTALQNLHSRVTLP